MAIYRERASAIAGRNTEVHSRKHTRQAHPSQPDLRRCGEEALLKECVIDQLSFCFDAEEGNVAEAPRCEWPLNRVDDIRLFLRLHARGNELARRQLIVRVTVVLCVTFPDVPLKERVCLPALALPPTVIVTVACAELVPLSVT